jgi:lauroyl/myristoyl acyltransferase
MTRVDEHKKKRGTGSSDHQYYWPPTVERERSHLPRIPKSPPRQKPKRKQLEVQLADVSAAIASWSARLVPDQLANRIATRFGKLTYRRFSGFRHNVESNMSQVLQAVGESPGKLDQLVEGVFVTNAMNVLELLRVPHMSSEDILASYDLVKGDWSTIESALDTKRGLIIITAHLGAFDYIGNVLHHRGYPLTVLTTRTTSPFVFAAVSFLRRSHKMKLVDATRAGIRQVITALANGECVALASDRDFVLSGKSTTFFGKETTLPIGAARLARDTSSIIVPLFTVWSGDRHLLYIDEPLEAPRTDNRDADIAETMTLIASSLERAISRAPDQWVMFQQVWPEQERLT